MTPEGPQTRAARPQPAGGAPGPTAPAPPRRLRTAAAAVLLALACLLVYHANGRQIGAGDTLPARYLPLGLWHHRTLALDPIARWVAQGHPAKSTWERARTGDGAANLFEPFAYWTIRGRDGRAISMYPVVTPLVVAPLYLPAVRWLDRHGWEQPQVDRVAVRMEKFAAALLAALASVAVFLLLRREAPRGALLLAVAFAFGTNTWMTSSQALWQHGAGELLIATALLVALGAPSPGRAALVGALGVAIAANRPPDALVAAAIGIHVLVASRRSAPWVLAGGALPLAAFVAYDLGLVGNLLGGYGKVTDAARYFGGSPWAGLAGLLASPGRGLLVFSPFLVLAGPGWLRRLRDPATRTLAAGLGLAVLGQIALYATMDWRAGATFGPRWLADLLPVLVWMLAPAFRALRPPGRLLFAAAVAFAIAVQAIGAFWYTGASDPAILAGDRGDLDSAVWSFAAAPFVAELRHPPAVPELACEARGSLDRVGATLRPDPAGEPPALAAGDPIEGWALACGRSPAQVLLLVDGFVVGRTDQLLPRPDVDAAMGTTAPAGWRVAADLRGVEAGAQILQLAVRVAPRSEPRIVGELRVRVVPAPAAGVAAPTALTPAAAPALGELAARAAAELRAHQDAAGYWLTRYTSEPRFVAPRPEMNTYLTAMIVDLLAPVAADAGLADAVALARRHLAAQIEPDGLVRYHGRPDGPTIGTLGCAITPDADDTALAWRLGAPPPGDPRRAPMLAELARWRRADGLYRTWLAPRERYQCLDPGRDPDPADATIQMHVWQMLRELDPPAARDLCAALARSIDDDAVWVYYARAPLVPRLRAAQLRRLGCAIAIPGARLATAAAGQEPWVAAVERLAAAGDAPPDPAARDAIAKLLAGLAADDFAALRREPPLLYHNDLTATVPRWYWSEDFGLALWLRLHALLAAGGGLAR